MNTGKLDPMLAKTLREEVAPATYQVLIRAAQELADAQWAVLSRHGVVRSPRPGRTITATLGRPAIEALSDLDWIETIRLAQTLRASS